MLNFAGSVPTGEEEEPVLLSLSPAKTRGSLGAPIPSSTHPQGDGWGGNPLPALLPNDAIS